MPLVLISSTFRNYPFNVMVTENKRFKRINFQADFYIGYFLFKYNVKIYNIPGTLKSLLNEIKCCLIKLVILGSLIKSSDK